MSKKPTVLTITGIRPDFIRMRNVFRKLDEQCHHVMLHTGQHYDDELSRVFFEDLHIRKPDFTLDTGRSSHNQYEQLSYLAKEVPKLVIEKNLKPDLILFLGDSNSALASVPLFKAGFKIGHIEGGMRSYDRRMPEEVNRVICDYVSDAVYVYTPLYKQRLIAENKPSDQIHVVGNTIVEIAREFMPTIKRTKDYILADIHRNENLATPEQLRHILTFLSQMGQALKIPVRLVRFNRAVRMIDEHNLLNGLANVELVGPFGFRKFLDLQFAAACVISDSGTGQEECPLLGVPVIVPRNATERPESVDNGNSLLVAEQLPVSEMLSRSMDFLNHYTIDSQKIAWLGEGNTSQLIVESIVKEFGR